MAAAEIRLLFAFGPIDLPRLHEVNIYGTVVLFTLALSLLAGVVLGALLIARLCLRAAGQVLSERRRARLQSQPTSMPSQSSLCHQAAIELGGGLG